MIPDRSQPNKKPNKKPGTRLFVWSGIILLCFIIDSVLIINVVSFIDLFRRCPVSVSPTKRRGAGSSVLYFFQYYLQYYNSQKFLGLGKTYLLIELRLLLGLWFGYNYQGQFCNCQGNRDFTLSYLGGIYEFSRRYVSKLFAVNLIVVNFTTLLYTLISTTCFLHLYLLTIGVFCCDCVRYKVSIPWIRHC